MQTTPNPMQRYGDIRMGSNHILSRLTLDEKRRKYIQDQVSEKQYFRLDTKISAIYTKRVIRIPTEASPIRSQIPCLSKPYISPTFTWE